MKLEILCGWAHPYKTIAKLIVHSIDMKHIKRDFSLKNRFDRLGGPKISLRPKINFFQNMVMLPT